MKTIYLRTQIKEETSTDDKETAITDGHIHTPFCDCGCGLTANMTLGAKNQHVIATVLCGRKIAPKLYKREKFYGIKYIEQQSKAKKCNHSFVNFPNPIRICELCMEEEQDEYRSTFFKIRNKKTGEFKKCYGSAFDNDGHVYNKLSTAKTVLRSALRYSVFKNDLEIVEYATFQKKIIQFSQKDKKFHG